MIKSNYNWQFKTDQKESEVKELADYLKVDPLIGKLLVQRGIETEDAAKNFFTPSLDNFYDPFLMNDMKKGVERIKQAIARNEQITVYGDYDADGITSTTIMYETLSDLGANVNYYIPSRFTEGYGPNISAFKNIINGGTSLIITVDNGVAGNEAIDTANRLGCEVIVSDHHDLPEKLPNAFAIIHPRVNRDEEHKYPFGDLCGAGVALKISYALLEDIPSDMFDLATIGTIADVVSLTDENRTIVQFGLQAIRNSQRPGLLALISKAGINLGQFDEQDIGFAIAPRLNSLGRIGDAKVGVELLSSFDEDQAEKLAAFANKQNNTRRSLVDEFYQAAEKQIHDHPQILHSKVLLIVGKDWHEGVIGIVASRLLDKYHRPTIVFSEKKDAGVLKGSGRSVDSFDLFSAINPIRDDLIGFGGHHSAVGLTLDSTKLSELHKQLEKSAEQQKLDISTKPTLSIAANLAVSKITSELLRKIKKVGPFGQDNPQPIFRFDFDKMTHAQTMGKNSDHLRFVLEQAGQRIGAVCFGSGSYLSEVTNHSELIEVAGELNENTWHNQTKIQIVVDDLHEKMSPIVDMRTSELKKDMFTSPGIYVFFHDRTMQQLLDYLPKKLKAVMYNQTNQIDNGSKLFIVDCPDVTQDLTDLISNCHPKQTILYLYKKNLISKIGMPDRKSYAKLFKFVEKHSKIDLSAQLNNLAKELGLPVKTTVYMIQVFLELDFITVKDKVMALKENFPSHDLKTAPSYQLRLEQLKAEKTLLAPDTNQLVNYVKRFLTTDGRKKTNGI